MSVTSATSALATLTVPSGATLVSWTLKYRKTPSETWLDYATGITATTQAVTGLDFSTPETASTYQFQPVVTLRTTGGVQTLTMPIATVFDAYRVVTANLSPAENTLNSRPWGVVLENTGDSPITSIRLTGRSTVSDHAEILGAWVIGGTIDAANFQGTTWERVKFSGGNTFTPGSGGRESPAFWASDRLVLANPILAGSRYVIRVQTGTGDVSSSLDFVGSCRPHYGDLVSAGLGEEGDYGSDLAHVQTDPSAWYTAVNGFVASVELGYEDTEPRPVAAAFGDSVIGAYIPGSTVRDGWPYACEQVMAAGRVVSHGFPGANTQTYCSFLSAWLPTAAADLYDTVILTPWSWNNLDTDASDIISAVSAALAAIVAAGKRTVLWIPVPSCLQSEGYGNPTTWAAVRAWAQTSGYPLIETWQAVATGGVGPTLASEYTGDGVHLNDAGQAIQGMDLGAEEAVVFG